MTPYHMYGAQMSRSIRACKIFARIGFPGVHNAGPALSSHLQARKCYATLGRLDTSQSSGSKPGIRRKAVTVVNDDGRVEWKDLTMGEKAARTTQQTFNFGVIVAGAVGTVLVGYYLYQEVFAADSKTRLFNQAVDQVRVDTRALELLGSGKTIRAFGEPSASKWTRNRPLASSVQKDRFGIEHFRMHFNVEGSERSGIVSLHMVKGPGDVQYQYRFLALDVPGRPRLYLENADATTGKKKPGFRMLGVQWR